VRINLNNVQKRIYGEKAVEFAFLSIGGLVFAQLFTQERTSLPLLITGIGLASLGLIASYLLLKDMKEGEKR